MNRIAYSASGGSRFDSKKKIVKNEDCCKIEKVLYSVRRGKFPVHPNPSA